LILVGPHVNEDAKLARIITMPALRTVRLAPMLTISFLIRFLVRPGHLVV
jgi:hypothetical protein